MLKDEPEVKKDDLDRETGLHSTQTFASGRFKIGNNFSSDLARVVRQTLRRIIFNVNCEEELRVQKQKMEAKKEWAALAPNLQFGMTPVARAPLSIELRFFKEKEGKDEKEKSSFTPKDMSQEMFLYIKSEVEKVWIRPANSCVCLIRAGTGR